MAKKRTSEQNRAIYLRRKARAQDRGYSGYGQMHYQETKRKKSQEFLGGQLEKLKEQFPGLEHINEVDMTPDRQRAYDRLVESKRFTPSELETLRHAGREDFWPIYRNLYQKLVM